MKWVYQAFFFTIGKKTETKKLRILKKLRVIPAKKLRLSEALCNVPGPKNWDYRRPYLVSSVQKNSEYEKNSKLSTKNSACRRVGPTRSSKNLVKKKPAVDMSTLLWSCEFAEKLNRLRCSFEDRRPIASFYSLHIIKRLIRLKRVCSGINVVMKTHYFCKGESIFFKSFLLIAYIPFLMGLVFYYATIFSKTFLTF